MCVCVCVCVCVCACVCECFAFDCLFVSLLLKGGSTPQSKNWWKGLLLAKEIEPKYCAPLVNLMFLPSTSFFDLVGLWVGQDSFTCPYSPPSLLSSTMITITCSWSSWVLVRFYLRNSVREMGTTLWCMAQGGILTRSPFLARH